MNHTDKLDKKYSELYINPDKGISEMTIKGWPRDRFEASVYFAGSGDKVIDIGCGNGKVLYSLRKHFTSLYGVELSQKRVEDSKKNLKNVNCQIFSGNVEEGLPQFSDDYFDVVICSDVIEHFMDVFSAFREMTRILKPSGRLVLNTPNFAKIKNRIKLLFGIFGSTSATEEGFGNHDATQLLDGGHLHYFTFSMLDRLSEMYRYKSVRHYGFGRFGKFHNICPSLLSASCQIVALKNDKQ